MSEGLIPQTAGKCQTIHILSAIRAEVEIIFYFCDPLDKNIFCEIKTYSGG
jgi:hypothetical protein